MTAKEIAEILLPKSPCDAEMLQEIISGTETAENWFLRKALQFIAKEEFDMTGYGWEGYVTNQEINPTVPVYRWQLYFTKDGNEETYREITLEVQLNRRTPVSVYTRVKDEKGQYHGKLVRHIRDGILDANWNTPRD